MLAYSGAIYGMLAYGGAIYGMMAYSGAIHDMLACCLACCMLCASVRFRKGNEGKSCSCAAAYSGIK